MTRPPIPFARIVDGLPIPRSSFVLVYGAITNRFKEIGAVAWKNRRAARANADSRKPGQWRRGPERVLATRGAAR